VLILSVIAAALVLAEEATTACVGPHTPRDCCKVHDARRPEGWIAWHCVPTAALALHKNFLRHAVGRVHPMGAWAAQCPAF